MTLRVWTELAGSLSGGQARRLRALLAVPDGARRSELDRLRKAETVTSGAGMVRALRRVSDVAGLGLGGVDMSAVPHRRVVALARYGMAAKATALRRHPEPRRLATLVATVRSLEARAVDDAFELFDVLMTNDLMARAARESRNEKTAIDDVGCQAPLEVQSWPACERNLTSYAAPNPDLADDASAPSFTRTTIADVPAAAFDDGTRIELYTGAATVVVFGTDPAQVKRAARAVPPYGQAQPPAVPLPQPVPGALTGTLPCASSPATP